VIAASALSTIDSGLGLVAVRIVRRTVATIRNAVAVAVAIAVARPAIMGTIRRAATIVVRCAAIGDRNLVGNTARQETTGGGDQY
jgi:hypothetical protein